jgi:hypothetical protein
MPILYQEDVPQSQKDILAIGDNDGEVVLRITKDGNITMPENWNCDEATLKFWESVLEFIPLDSSEQIQRMTLLVKSYTLFKHMMDKGGLDKDKVPQELRNNVFDIYDELRAFFNNY